MNDVLKNQIKNLPQLPGVYRYYDEAGRLLYIGKSKHLRQRVRSYFTGAKEGKVARLVRAIHSLSYEQSHTHLEARLLECYRIKQFKPPYNAQFKRDRYFVYLKLGEDFSKPGLRVSQDPKGAWGPFRNRHLMERVMAAFAKLYPIERQETNFKLAYQVLARRQDDASFAGHREALRDLFSHEDLWQAFLDNLRQAMETRAANLKFQEAIFYRDFLTDLQLMKRYWFEDDKLFNALLFARIPMADGFKYYRIHRGVIQDMVFSQEADFKAFCQHSQTRLRCPWLGFSPSAQLDFRDILFSEVRSLPEADVVFGSDKASGAKLQF